MDLEVNLTNYSNVKVYFTDREISIVGNKLKPNIYDKRKYFKFSIVKIANLF